MTVTFKARVASGRLTLDEPVDLPDGTVLELVPAEQGDDLDDPDRARLHRALQRSADEFVAGRGIPADEALAQVRATERD